MRLLFWELELFLDLSIIPQTGVVSSVFGFVAFVAIHTTWRKIDDRRSMPRSLTTFLRSCNGKLGPEKFLVQNGLPLWAGMPHESARGHVHDVLLAAVSSLGCTMMGQANCLILSRWTRAVTEWRFCGGDSVPFLITLASLGALRDIAALITDSKDFPLWFCLPKRR